MLEGQLLSPFPATTQNTQRSDLVTSTRSPNPRESKGINAWDLLHNETARLLLSIRYNIKLQVTWTCRFIMKWISEVIRSQTVPTNLIWSWRVCWGDEEKSASSERLSPEVHLLWARHTYTSTVHFSIREKLSETRPVSFEATKSFIFAYQMGGAAYRRGTFPPTVNQASLYTAYLHVTPNHAIRNPCVETRYQYFQSAARPLNRMKNPQSKYFLRQGQSEVAFEFALLMLVSF